MTLAVRGLRFRYASGREVLRGVDLDVPAGTSTFLLGASGSGKSTLLRCIAGLESAYEGRVLVDDRAVDGLPPHRRRLGMLFQEPALFPHLTAWQNAAFGLRYRDDPPADERREAAEWLALVGLGDRLDARVDQFSGGERQRVALVRTLAAKPRAVLLDEPLSALDRELREDVGTRIKTLLAARQVPALWVTHDRDEARRLADRILVLRDGVAQPLG